MINSVQNPQAPRQLELERCPHCKVATPNLQLFNGIMTGNSEGERPREWAFYHCSRCGGVIATAWQRYDQGPAELLETYSSDDSLDESIDSVAREYLKQCKDSLHAPAGAVMLAASAVDAMLKAKGYKDGSLYQRIKEAAAGHIITADMATWAHQVRLDANDQRHADESASFPTREEAQRSLDFALTLAEILFVLPTRVTRGINESVN